MLKMKKKNVGLSPEEFNKLVETFKHNLFEAIEKKETTILIETLKETKHNELSITKSFRLNETKLRTIKIGGMDVFVNITPLGFAAFCGWLAGIEILIEHGANVRTTSTVTLERDKKKKEVKAQTVKLNFFGGWSERCSNENKAEGIYPADFALLNGNVEAVRLLFFYSSPVQNFDKLIKLFNLKFTPSDLNIKTELNQCIEHFSQFIALNVGTQTLSDHLTQAIAKSSAFVIDFTSYLIMKIVSYVVVPKNNLKERYLHLSHFKPLMLKILINTISTFLENQKIYNEVADENLYAIELSGNDYSVPNLSQLRFEFYTAVSLLAGVDNKKLIWCNEPLFSDDKEYKRFFKRNHDEENLVVQKSGNTSNAASHKYSNLSQSFKKETSKQKSAPENFDAKQLKNNDAVF